MSSINSIDSDHKAWTIVPSIITSRWAGPIEPSEWTPP